MKIKQLNENIPKWKRVQQDYGNEIVNLYVEQEMYLKELGIKFDLEPQAIRRILVELGITPRTKSESKNTRNRNWANRTYDLNENYFEKWSSNMAYILGFVYADGSLTTSDYKNEKGYIRKRNRLKIVVAEDDRQILDDIKMELEYSGNIAIRESKISGSLTGKNHCELSLSSKSMIELLLFHGLTENKSLTKTFPNIPKEYEIDFIRGYFDGNGSIGKQYPINSKGSRTETCQIRVRICSGSLSFISTIQEVLVGYGMKKKNVLSGKGKRSNVHEICYSTNESLKLFDLLYSNKDGLKLNRKFESFKEYIEQRKIDVKNSTGYIKIK